MRSFFVYKNVVEQQEKQPNHHDDAHPGRLLIAKLLHQPSASDRPDHVANRKERGGFNSREIRLQRPPKKTPQSKSYPSAYDDVNRPLIQAIVESVFGKYLLWA